MNYRHQALVLGAIFLFAGALTLAVLISQTAGQSSDLAGNTIALLGLGLLLIGSLITFSAPKNLIASEIATNVIVPASQNLALVLGDLLSETQAMHVPVTVLAGKSDVTLVFLEEPKEQATSSKEADRKSAIAWGKTRKVVEPMGIGLMKGYEEALKRDFLEVEIQQLSRLLNRAIVTELQLASQFSLREIAQDRLEASWSKAVVEHTCIAEGTNHNPSLCCLCSSVACALAKATGKPTQIEACHSGNQGLTVLTTYRVLSG